MLRSTIEKRFLIKSIAINAVLFFVSLQAMEPAEPTKCKRLIHKKKTIKKVQEVDCGLFPGLIPQDIVENCIRTEFYLENISHIKRVNKACNNYWSLLCPLPYGCASSCSLLACRHLAAHFDECSRVLAHYASCNNENMFKHLYYRDQEKRNMNVAKMLSIEQPTFKDCMNVYRGDVFNEKEKVRMRSLKLVNALHSGDRTAVQILLLHKNFGISEGTGFFDTLLKSACQFGDIEVLLKIIGGVAHINEVDCFGYAAIHYAFRTQKNLFSQLIKHGADINQCDRHGKTVLFDAVHRSSTVDELRKVLELKPTMNIVCDDGRTAAHEAVIAYTVHDDYDIEKIDLLLEAGIDVRISDKDGRTFLYYASTINGSRKLAMKALLKKHKIKGAKKKIRLTKPASEGASGYKGPLRS